MKSACSIAFDEVQISHYGNNLHEFWQLNYSVIARITTVAGTHIAIIKFQVMIVTYTLPVTKILCNMSILVPAVAPKTRTQLEAMLYCVII